MDENKFSITELKAAYNSLPKVIQGKNFQEISDAQ
jgi:hypothetical protein